MKLPIRADAATVRAWAVETGRKVGSRGAISAELHNQYVMAAAGRAVQRAALAVGRLAVAATPSLKQAAANRNTRRQQELGQ